MGRKHKVISKDDFENQIIAEAEYTVAHKSTVRQTALEFGRCKSAIHRDLTVTLPEIAKAHPKYKKLHKNALKVLKTNKDERHIRGGESTKRRAELCRNEKNSTRKKRNSNQKVDKVLFIDDLAIEPADF